MKPTTEELLDEAIRLAKEMRDALNQSEASRIKYRECIKFMGNGIMKFLETDDKKHLTDCLENAVAVFKPTGPPVP